MDTTIILLVSRPDFLERVLTSIELLECDAQFTNILCIVDGPPALFVRVRNLVADMKFKNRLTVSTNPKGTPPLIDIQARRQRIVNAHNLARSLVAHDHGFVFSIEDDTLVGRLALKRLTSVANTNRAFGMVEGVEVGRWGVPYIGAWKLDDIYDPRKIESVEYQDRDAEPSRIDAGGLYCALIRADLYKQHEFTCKNGLGPDVNLGIELRQLGFDNFINWAVHCIHLNTTKKGVQEFLPSEDAQIVTLSKMKSGKWHTSY